MLIYLLTHSVKTNVSIANCVSRTVVFTRGDAKMKTLTHTDTSRPSSCSLEAKACTHFKGHKELLYNTESDKRHGGTIN